MSPTVWTEPDNPAQGWQEGIIDLSETLTDDFFIDVLFEGAAFSSGGGNVFVESQVSASAYTETSGTAPTWTERTG